MMDAWQVEEFLEWERKNANLKVTLSVLVYRMKEIRGKK
jgi:hypothetical protein